MRLALLPVPDNLVTIRSMSDTRTLTIGFIHPDLGIGGAERLVVDAAVHLQAAGHRVALFTSHHDRDRCFEETGDGTLDVRVYGDFLPSHVGNRLRAPCAIARMAYLAWAMALSGKRFEVIFCDLVSHAMPLLRLLSGAKLLYYCHFPDQLLAPEGHWLYRLYREPIDRLEEVTTGMADRVMVNSHFTANEFRRIFPRLRAKRLEVLYPGVDCEHYRHVAASPPTGDEGSGGPITLLSVNRYERTKNVGLAIEALAHLRERISSETFAGLELVIAGGYDDRLAENRRTLRELQSLAQRLRLDEKVVFLRSCSEAERLELLRRCRCVVYTPENEHFGYVPVEAMAAGRPVVAVDSGGPLETVRNEETGLLCRPTPEAFSEALTRLIVDAGAARRMGEAGRAHALRAFSRSAFGARLETIVQEVVA